MKYYLKSIDETMTQVASQASGLAEAEASKRLEANGLNKLAEAKRYQELYKNA